jgi:hypothetical protein
MVVPIVIAMFVITTKYNVRHDEKEYEYILVGYLKTHRPVTGVPMVMLQMI